MIKVTKNSEYYKQFEAMMKDDLDLIRYHGTQAENWAKIYAISKRHGGLWILMQWLAGKMNQYHVQAGTKKAKESMRWCLSEVNYLIKYINENKD